MLSPLVFVIQTIKFLFASLIQTNPCVTYFCPFFFLQRKKITCNYSLKGSDSSNLKIFSDSCCVILHTTSAWHASRDSYFIDNLSSFAYLSMSCHCGSLMFWFRIQYSWKTVDKFNAYFTLKCFSFKVHLVKENEAIKTNNNAA